MNPTKFYVTTPIYYINDVPHIGHAYSTIAADVLARHYRTKIGETNVIFSTGTDENSKKTIEAASAAGLSPEHYTEKTAQLWRDTWDKLGISYTNFIRTTSPKHHVAVSHFVSKLYEAGDIYKGNYEGLYCFRCEAFYREDETDNGNCPIHHTELERISEENWFFALSKYTDKLRQWISSAQNPIRPAARKNEVLAFLERGLEDISISRAKQELGIPVPFDKDQKIYVWVDALINYLTVAGYPTGDYQPWWQNVHHIVGKDIIKFHCLIWPAMLLSVGEELPQVIFAHGFFTIDGEKISKSLKNAIDPISLVERYGNDALRYYLLREIPFGADGDFSHERFRAVYDADLANNLGNLVQRLAVLNTKFNDSSFIYHSTNLPNSDAIEYFEFSKALALHFTALDNCNQALEVGKPWQTAKTDMTAARACLNEVTSHLVDIAGNLAPLLPDTSAAIAQLFHNGRVMIPKTPLFPKKQ